jgi:hypothetical protein
MNSERINDILMHIEASFSSDELSDVQQYFKQKMQYRTGRMW